MIVSPRPLFSSLVTIRWGKGEEKRGEEWWRVGNGSRRVAAGGGKEEEKGIKKRERERKQKSVLDKRPKELH